jgi:hypothetical protein
VRPAFRFARFDDVRGHGLDGWYAVVDPEVGRTHVAQLVFLPGFRTNEGPRLLVEFDDEPKEFAGEIERRSSWTGPFGTVEEARAEGRRLCG